MSQEQEEGERVRGEQGPSEDGRGPSEGLRLRLLISDLRALTNKAAALSPEMQAEVFGSEVHMLITWLGRAARLQADTPAEQAATDRGKPMGGP